MSVILRAGLTVVLLLVCQWMPLVAQEPGEAPPEPGYEFVSGTIAELPPGRIVVNRAVLGKPPETRSFLLTQETKIEGRLRTKARVTVGFRLSEDGEPVAVRVIVRPPAPAKKP